MQSASSNQNILTIINESFTCKVDVTIAKVTWIDKEKNMYEMDYYDSAFLMPGEKKMITMKPGYYAIMVQAFDGQTGELIGSMSGHGPWPPPNGIYNLIIRCGGVVKDMVYGNKQVCAEIS